MQNGPSAAVLRAPGLKTARYTFSAAYSEGLQSSV